MPYKVLKDFNGSPDGMAVIGYTKGTVVELAPSLAEVALTEKWVKETDEEVTGDPAPGSELTDVPVTQPDPAV